MAYTRGDVFVKKESTWGTGVDPTQPTSGAMEILGLDSAFEYSVTSDTTAVQPASMSRPSEITYHTSKPTAKIDFVYNSCMPFALMMGGVAATTPVEGQAPYTWTITQTDPIPFTTSVLMKGGTADKNVQLAGCYAQSLSFRLGLNGPATGGMDIVAKSIDIAGTAFTAPTTITLDDAVAWKPHDFTYAIGAITGIAYITDIDFTISRSIDVGHGLAARAPSTAFTGRFDAIKGNITCYVPDSATANEIEQLVLGGTTIGEALTGQEIVLDYKTYTDTTADTAKITLSNCIFSSMTTNFPLDTKGSYRFGFSATHAAVLWESPISAITAGYAPSQE